jgi:predicted small lipoprotein YifL
MKRILISLCIIATTLTIAGCTQKINDKPQAEKQATTTPETAPTDNTIKTYENTDLGIKFNYLVDGIAFNGKISVKDNVIYYDEPGYSPLQYIAVFTKKDNQTVEEVILAAVKAKGKDPKNCVVVNNGGYLAVPQYQEYVLDLANPKITYTKAELQEIKQADIQTAKDGGPFDGEMAKKEIYNRHLIDKCSDYADPLGLATSKTSPSRFVYDGKNKIIFLPGLSDPAFYQDDSIQLTD